MHRIVRHLIAGASAAIVFPALCLAQFGAIAGVVKDSTGAAVPGAMVQAANPASIEGARTAVSDSSGQYRIEQLSPGTYSVTFTKTGFNTFREQGIEISEGFTAPVNGSLTVGAVQQTISVEAQAPVVDVQNVTEEKAVEKLEIDALPTAKTFATIGVTLPSVTMGQFDVGGSQGERGNTLSAHGGNLNDMTLSINGLPIGNQANSQAWSDFSLNDAAVQEMSYQTDAISAESSSGGVRVNAIPREGGNAFHGEIFGNYSSQSLEMTNLTATEKAQGLTTAPRFDSLHDESAGFGGPIIKDRVWFYYAQRYRENDQADVNVFYSINPLAPTYNPSTTPAHYGGFDGDNQIRITTQLTPRNKVSFLYDKVNKCNCPTIVDVANFSAEAQSRLVYPGAFGNWIGAITWQAVITPKLLLDAAVSYETQRDGFTPLVSDVGATSPIAVFEIGALGAHFLRAPTPGTFTGGVDERDLHSRGGLSYVTGRHSVKVGFDYHYGHTRNYVNETSDDVSYTTIVTPGGNINSATYYNAPYVTYLNIPAEMGLYAQDKWTLRRLTLSGGIRFDYVNGSIPAQTVAANSFLPAHTFSAVPNVPNWKDIDPRIGAAYDLFGNHKTAIKVSVSRYVTANVYSLAGAVNPISCTTCGSTETRSILGPNGSPFSVVDFNAPPNGNPLNPAANGILGPGPANLGESVISTTYDPKFIQGWGKRPYNWEYTAAVQHELVSHISIEAGYFRRTFGNQSVTNNTQLTSADFTSYCVNVPASPYLGKVSGSQLCGLADLNSAALASLTSNQQITFANHFAGTTKQYYDGFDLNVNARPTRRFFVLAGMSIGRTITNNCAVYNGYSGSGTIIGPQSQLFCASDQPFQGSYRVSGGYNFPWKIQLSGVYQSIPPASFQPTYAVTSAAPGITLGRSIISGGGTNTVPVVAPYTFFLDRVNQVDLRVTKTIPIETSHIKGRLELMADLYNALNASPVTGRVAAIGAGFYAPTSILQAGFLKVGGRFTF
jgi:hypothetical protein